MIKIFLEGGISGNLREFWTKAIKIYQEGTKTRPFIFEESMKVFLAGDNGKKKILSNYDFSQKLSNINILESYYYLRKNDDFMALIKHFSSFLLDSGAFTFMSGSHKGEVNWEQYVEEYAKFINKHDIKLFFELDIDSIVGLERTEYLRSKLEYLTGKKPIPVWHKNRGKDYFVKMCENYPYVAIGGIVTKEIPKQIYEKGFPWFIKTAHDYGCKIHGLGYTNIQKLAKYHFDSVDSTAWLYGNRGGFLYHFNPQNGTMEQINKKGFRLKAKEGAVNNFNEWVKFSEYADKYL